MLPPQKNHTLKLTKPKDYDYTTQFLYKSMPDILAVVSYMFSGTLTAPEVTLSD